MKRVLFLVVLMSIFCFASSVFAEEGGRRLRRNTFYHLFGIPIYFFLEINVHEGSHALGALSTGGRVISYNPYPHYNNEGAFRFGSTMVSWDTDRSGGVENNIRAFTLLAPAISQISIFVISDLLISYVPDLNSSFWGPVLYLAGMVCPWIDFVFNLYNQSSSCDFARAAEFLGERRELFYAFGTFIAAVGLWRLIHHFIRIFTERVENNVGDREGDVN